MRLPIIEGVIRRRILINFQIDPDIVSKFLPPAFSPKIVKGKSIIGICLIRLENIRPKSFPMNLGIHSENVAHRIAVNWTDETGILREGVYIFRRDSNSWLNTLFGGRLFPGEHNQAQFFIDEKPNYIDILVRSNDTKVKIHARGLLQKNTLRDSIFESMDELSDFFKSGSEGYSPVEGKKCYQGMCLIPHEWNMQLLKQDALEVSYFKDELGINEDDLKFDSIVMMKDIRHEWKSLKTIIGETREL